MLRRSKLAVLLVCAVAQSAGAEHAAREPGSVIVVKRAGVFAYEEVAEEVADRCRVRAHLVTLDDGNVAAFRASLKAGDVVVAIGQRAVDAVAGTPAHVIAALAFSVPPGVISADALPPPELTLRALKLARPSVRRIGVVHGPSTAGLVKRLIEQAAALNVTVVPIRANDGPGAVRELRRAAPQVEALWLAPDLDVLTPQLFQYALALEIKRALPLGAVTRQQVKSGALLAYDADPHAIGRQAADLVHQILAGAAPSSLVAAAQTGSVELTVNADVARRLGADVAALRTLGARVE